ncbi:hypothetical protein BaRGS_00013897, partial [Batillaria attramentaria]
STPAPAQDSQSIYCNIVFWLSAPRAASRVHVPWSAAPYPCKRLHHRGILPPFIGPSHLHGALTNAAL